ncbi:MAG: hypothetical protein PWR12_1434 [Eubacteriaceae bacterium]|jgi:uncharacterized membrane protein HdeD (DUF308 family)|nr:hypothetical protein [Eubacteriaceae bacterium]MDK2935879.1 hypothetical protein [Eubacteriaceae bacterium]MDK2961654.1 hypothetical protein [Eubacteriaceae bacterium]
MDKKNLMKFPKLAQVQILWGLAGIILFSASAFTFLKGENALVEIAPYLGLSMLFSGLINIYIYRRTEKSLHGSHWLLADGVSTSLLSLFLLFNQMIQAALIPFFLGVWELFTGILKLLDCKELKEDAVSGWRCFCLLGSIELISGVASLLKPVDEFMGMNVVVAIILFIQGCSYFFKIKIYLQLVK